MVPIKLRGVDIRLDVDKYIISIGYNGLMITPTIGNGEEKDCEVEYSWDELYRKEAL